MRARFPALCLVLVGLLPLVRAQAAEVEVTAHLDRQRVAVNEPVKLTLTIVSVRQLVHVPAPELDLGEFEVYGPAMSTRMEIVNSRTSFSRDLVYTLFPRRQGRHTIGAATFVIDGKRYQTQPLHLDVTPPRQPGRRGASQTERGDGDELSDNLFLRAVADRDTVFVGQQVTVSFDLCYRYNLRDVGFSDIPTFSGFWAKEIFVAQRLEPVVEVIEGRQFHVAPLRRMALFPTHDGVHEIDPMVVSCAIPQRRQRRSAFDAFSLFDDPLFGRTRSVMVRSVPLRVVALPLPAQGQPEDFSGLVGQIHVEAHAEPRRVAVGDPVTLRVRISGTGNLQSLKAPVLNVDGLQIYEPKGAVEPRLGAAGQLGGEANYEYILIPERAGRFEIPAIRVAYFDPTARQYRITASQALPFSSEGTATAAGDSSPTFDMTRREIEELGSDIRHIKPDVDELRSVRPLYRQPLFWGVQLLLPLAYIGLSLVRRHQERLLVDVAYARRRGALAAAQRRLQAAKESLASGEASFFAALHIALLSYIADQFNESAPGLNRARCRDLLQQRRVSPALIERLEAQLEACERGRFAPSPSSPDQRRRVLADTEALIDDLQEAM